MESNQLEKYRCFVSVNKLSPQDIKKYNFSCKTSNFESDHTTNPTSVSSKRSFNYAIFNTNVNSPKSSKEWSQELFSKFIGQSPIQAIKCFSCNEHFKTKTQLTLHCKASGHALVFECTGCEKKFKKHCYMVRHFARIHTNLRPYKCDICEKGFKSRAELELHSNNVHVDAKPFPCTKCNKKFKTRGHLRDHFVVHSLERAFACELCPRNSGFKRKISLVRHYFRVHTLEKPFSCTHCPKQFSFQMDLTIHVRSHTGKGGKECKYCAKKFNTTHQLKQHTVTHTGESDFMCTMCSYAAKSQWALNTHLRAHTGERPFGCKHCDATFKHSSSLSKHLRRRHL